MLGERSSLDDQSVPHTGEQSEPLLISNMRYQKKLFTVEENSLING